MTPQRDEGMASAAGLAAAGTGFPAPPAAPEGSREPPPAVQALHRQLERDKAAAQHDATRSGERRRDPDAVIAVIAAIDEAIAEPPPGAGTSVDQNWPDAAFWRADGSHEMAPRSGWPPPINQTLRGGTRAQQARDDLHGAACDTRRPNGRAGYVWRRSDAWALEQCRANAAVGEDAGGAAASDALEQWETLTEAERESVSDGSL